MSGVEVLKQITHYKAELYYTENIVDVVIVEFVQLLFGGYVLGFTHGTVSILPLLDQVKRVFSFPLFAVYDR